MTRIDGFPCQTLFVTPGTKEATCQVGGETVQSRLTVKNGFKSATIRVGLKSTWKIETDQSHPSCISGNNLAGSSLSLDWERGIV